ncbi:MAG TPA: hypothetical protein PK919_08040 [Candidatus Aminicenantes bacterium]|nr:hypothetical protein [Candidatus Aminicenantes bacterium]
MKRTTTWIGAALILLLACAAGSCKKSEVETATLKVILSVGVTGTPAAGEYTMNVGEERSYAYSLETGYKTLTVLLDGKAVAASGSFTVSGDHVLQAFSEGNQMYTLSVTLEDGVTGTPASGNTYHTQGTTVPYSYAPASGYVDLKVKLDGVDAAASGTVAMTKDRVIFVTVEKLFNILGQWRMEEAYNDGSDFDVVATFSGTAAKGTVSDSQGGSGDYVVSGGEINFTLKFPDVTYEYAGDFTDDNTMSGTCKRYRSSDSVVIGEWTATRVTSASNASVGGGRKG